MRRILPLVIVLAILVMAQSVVAMMPGPSPAPAGAQIAIIEGLGGAAPLPPTDAALGALPQPMSLVLLMTGLSGLTAAGCRPARESESPPTR